MVTAPVGLLEVIATSVEDAVTAQRGGAGRLELVSAMEQDGLTPDLDLARRIRDAVSIQLRVMLRPHAGFGISPHELASLVQTARAFRAAGFDRFVLGFLSPDATPDLPALEALATAVQPARWTLHRAFDRTPDQAAAFAACAGLSGLDRILTSGGPGDLESGLQTLCDRAAWQTDALRWIAGGGLRLEHVPPLRAAGITEFHTGRAVRAGQRWHGPVDENRVRYVVEAVRGGVSHPSRSS